MKCKFLLFSIFTCGSIFGQKTVSVSVEAGLGPKAKNVFDSAYVNPRHQNTRLIGISFNVDEIRCFRSRFFLGMSIRNSIVFAADNWINSNDIMPGSSLPKTGKKFLTGSYGVYTLKSSLFCPVSFAPLHKSGRNIQVAYSPELAIYWPITDYRVNTQVFNPVTGFVYTLYDGISDFKKGEMAYTRFALKFEHNFSVRIKFKVFRRNMMGADFCYHIGAKNLEETRLIFYPSLPQFRAKIHYSQNNNYCSLAFRYYFEKRKLKK